MRYWLFGGIFLIFFAGLAQSQDAKKKGKDSETPFVPEVTDIAGKGFEQWAKEIHAKDPSDREIAIKTIVNFGAERAYKVVPEILKEMEKHKPASPIDLSVRVNAVISLGIIFQHKKEPDPKHLKEAVAVFKSGIEDKQAILKIRALQALPFLGPVSRELLPEVVKAIRDPTTWESRKEAISTLAFLIAFDVKAGPPAGAQKALFEALEDSSAIVRHAALQSLVAIGQASSEAEKKLIFFKFNSVIAKDSRNIVIIEAHKSVINLKRKAFLDPIDPLTKKEHLDPLERMVSHKDPTTKLNALQALGAIGPAAGPATTTVMNALRDSDPSIEVTAMVTLVQMEAFMAIPTLKGIMEDKQANRNLKLAAEESIDHLEYVSKIRNEEKKKTDKKTDKKLDKK